MKRSGSKPAPRAASSPAGPSTPEGSPSNRYVNAYVSGDVLVTIQRAPDGKVTRRAIDPDYSMFMRAEDAPLHIRRELAGSSAVLSVREEPGGWVRVRWRTAEIRKHVANPKGLFAIKGIKTYEADLDPVRRWIVDQNIEIGKPRRCFLDIETDSRVAFARKSTARILCWSVISDDGERRTVGILEVDTDLAERDLLLALWRELAEYDQVVAWNGGRFDFPMIETRSKQRGINIDPKRWLWLDHMILFRRLNASAAESGEEKQSMALAKVAHAVDAGEKLEDEEGDEIDGSRAWELWSSGEKGRRQLGEYCANDSELMRGIEAKTGYIGLHQTVCELTHVFPDTWGINPTQQVEGFLLRLGLDRAEPMHFRSHFYVEDTEKFRGAWCMAPASKGIARDVHVLDFAGLYPSIILTWNMSPETWRPDVVLRESGEGRPVYLAHIPLREYPIPDGCCAAPITDKVFANEPEGVLAMALHEIRRLRKFWMDRLKKLAPGTPEAQEAKRRAAAYKIVANSFYGVMGSKFSRFYERAVAESIAQTAVWLIQATVKAAEERGLRVIYADTDGAFVVGCTKAEFDKFVAWCNVELYPPMTASKKCTRHFLELAAEKGYERLVLVSKKRYAASWAYYKDTKADADSKPEIKGLEYKRGDAVRLARQLQEEVIHKILGYRCAPSEDPEDFAGIIERYREHVIGDALPFEDVMLAKKLAKPLREYVRKQKKAPKHEKLVGEEVAIFHGKRKTMAAGVVSRVTPSYIAVSTWKQTTIVDRTTIDEVAVYAAQPPHVQVARVLAERGRDVGQGVRVEYVVIDGSDRLECIPAEDFAGEYDRFYLWDSLIYPPTQRVLEAAFPGDTWTKWERTRPEKVVAPKAQTSIDVGEQRVERRKRSEAKKPTEPSSDIQRQGNLFGT